jgi:hypothetical protein
MTLLGCLTRVTRRVPLVEEELLTLPEHLRLQLIYTGFPVAKSLAFCVVLCRLFFCFLVLFCFSLYSVLLQIMASDDPFNVFKFSFFITQSIIKYFICQCGNLNQNTRQWCKLGGELDLYSNWNSLPEYRDFYNCLV